jgi:hypothetical protein
MPKSTDLEELLDAAEDVTRCASVGLRNMKAYFISDSLMKRLKQAVATYRPTPYHLEGGRKVRTTSSARKPTARQKG